MNSVALFGEEVDSHRLLHRLYSAEHVLDCAVMAKPLTGAKHPNTLTQHSHSAQDLQEQLQRLLAAVDPHERESSNRLRAWADEEE
jgi:hypothetical protein